MRGINIHIIGGNLGADPEMTAIGEKKTPCCRMRVATTRKFKGRDWKEGDELKEDTTWHRVVVMGPVAANCGKFLKKGSAVLAHGEARHDHYEDDDGEDRMAHYLRAYRVDFLGTGNGKSGRNAVAAFADTDAGDAEPTDEQLVEAGDLVEEEGVEPF